MPPFITVIIPTHNRATMIERALQSVYAQTWRDFELIVVDDGSTDGTSELAMVRSGDPRLRVLRLPENRGVSYARNVGVRAASAPWIAFLDSDDEWLPAKLERQIRWTKEHPAGNVVQTKEIWIRRGQRVNPPKTHEKFGGDLFAASLERCMITPSSVLLRKALITESGGFNEMLPACEDYDLWLKITCRHTVGLIEEDLLIRYGGHADQLSATVPVLDRYRIQSLCDLLESAALSSSQKSLARASLLKRARIVAQGYQKRGNHEEYRRYAAIIEHYR
jgi:glycosyltransferase involved in cell wall biosynthesis